MQKFIVLFLGCILWCLLLTSTAIAAPPINKAPIYDGPKAQRLNEGSELKIEKPRPISIKDPDGNLKEVELEVINGTLSVTTATGTVKGVNTKQMTISGTQAVINGALKTLTYKKAPKFIGEDRLSVTSIDTAGMKSTEIIPITVTQVSDSTKTCNLIHAASKSGQEFGGFGGYFSAGPSISYSLVQYNLADKKSSLNATAAGAGISIRFYDPNQLTQFGERSMGRPRKSKKWKEGTPIPGGGSKWADDTDITEVPSECRATTYEFGAKEKIHSWISLAPTVYAFQEKDADDFGVQLALNVGIIDDIFTIGAGWNLSGDNAGEWFILFGPSVGFDF